MEFRKFRLEDKLAFLELDLCVFSEDDLNPDEYEELLQNEGFIGLFDPDLIGYVFLRISNSYGHLVRLGVFSKYQKKGYGTQLMNFAINFFVSHNCSKVGLYVETNNEQAIPLYFKFGFKIVFESWHYILQINEFSVHPDPNYQLIATPENRLLDILTTFPYLEKDIITKYIEQKTTKILVDQSGRIYAFIRFNPIFSGCMPFEMVDLSTADQVIAYLIKDYIRDNIGYLRLTFDRYDWLAKIYQQRGYKQHHHLYKMELLLK